MTTRLADLDIRKEPSLIESTQSPILFSEETKAISPWLREVEWYERLIYFWLSHRIFRPLEQEVVAQTPEIPKKLYSYLLTINRIKPRFKIEEEPPEPVQEALFSVVMEFSKVEKVKSIYVQRYGEELQVQVLLSVTQYDSELMDVLLDIEYNIRKWYPEIVFEFFYPPAGISDKKDFIHPQAQCIYMR